MNSKTDALADEVLATALAERKARWAAELEAAEEAVEQVRTDRLVAAWEANGTLLTLEATRHQAWTDKIFEDQVAWEEAI